MPYDLRYNLIYNRKDMPTFAFSEKYDNFVGMKTTVEKHGYETSTMKVKPSYKEYISTHNTNNTDMNTYKIQANASGTRSINVTEAHLKTIKQYALMRNLVDSNGIIDESVLDKLKLNARAALEAAPEADKRLTDLCLDVIYNDNMKAFGLRQLADLYAKWEKSSDENTESQSDSHE